MGDKKSQLSQCGVCHTAANNAVRVAAAFPHDDSAALAMHCHLNAIKKQEHAEAARGKDDATDADKANAARYDAIADMMHDRVCPMLPSAMGVGKDKSDKPVAQHAYAIEYICSSLC